MTNSPENNPPTPEPESEADQASQEPVVEGEPLDSTKESAERNKGARLSLVEALQEAFEDEAEVREDSQGLDVKSED